MESGKLQAFESRIQLKESEIPLMIGIWNSVSTKQECGIEYLESGIHSIKSRNPRLSWIPLHEAILPMTIGTSIISLSLVVFAALACT